MWSSGEIGDEIEVKTFFFRDHHDFGRKIVKDEIKESPFSFLENINFWKFLPQAPEFEHPPLHRGILF